MKKIRSFLHNIGHLGWEKTSCGFFGEGEAATRKPILSPSNVSEQQPLISSRLMERSRCPLFTKAWMCPAHWNTPSFSHLIWICWPRQTLKEWHHFFITEASSLLLGNILKSYVKLSCKQSCFWKLIPIQKRSKSVFPRRMKITVWNSRS